MSAELDVLVNGERVHASVAPRMPLAEFLRERMLLTGTHVGCSQGVCGACTVLLDGEPARSCIIFAAACQGCQIQSIEGLEDDTVTIALRAAFSAEHALQCGYCTPGMLVTARDIVLRLPDADDARIRLELAGNLCRCTGYLGIVRAIRRVLDARLNLPTLDRSQLTRVQFTTIAEAVPSSTGNLHHAPGRVRNGGGNALSQTLDVGLPASAVWMALKEPSLVAGCVPGATLRSVVGDKITGELLTALGPMRTRFEGSATLSYDDLNRSGTIIGEGRDAASRTQLRGEAAFWVKAVDDGASQILLDVSYSLRGPLAQFGRAPVVSAFAAEIALAVARNLEARLRGQEPPVANLTSFGLLARALLRWLRLLLLGPTR